MARTLDVTLTDKDRISLSVFAMVLDKPFDTYAEAVAYTLSSEQYGATGDVQPVIKQTISEEGDGKALPQFFSAGIKRNTSLGGNDAINPLWQFCRYDDISYTVVGTDNTPGLSRVYEEEYNRKQQILWLSAGRAVFNTLENWYDNAIISDYATLVTTGKTTIAESVAELFGNTTGYLVMLPAVPFLYLKAFIKSLSGRAKMTRYFDFEADMGMYWRYVNGIVQTLVVNLGIETDGHYESAMSGSKEAAGSVNVGTNSEKYSAGSDALGYVPTLFQSQGWDMYRISSRRLEFERRSSLDKSMRSDDVFRDNASSPAPASPSEHWLANAWSWVKTNATAAVGEYASSLASNAAASAMDAQLYIGFRISRVTDTSESISNSSGESQLAQTLNSKIQAANQTKFKAMFGQVGDSALGKALGDVVGGFTDAADSVFSNIGMANASEILKGNGILDIPEMWQSSSFSRSYSFEIPLKSALGDPYSILSSVLVPWACLAPFIFARAVGNSAYTSPMLVKAYCKGFLSINAGLVESATISRGGDQHGWTDERLPTSITVSFQIKELSPALYMPMPSLSDIFQTSFGSNSAFQEYLLTLTGIGLAERTTLWANIKRRVHLLKNLVYTERLSKHAQGFKLGQTTFGQAIGHVVPATYLPNN